MNVHTYINLRIKNDKKLLYQIADQLQYKIPQDAFSKIAATSGMSGQTRDDQVKAINSMLQPIINELSEKYPNVGMGIYSMEHDSVVAIGPNFNSFLLRPASHDLPYFKVYNTGKPELISCDLSYNWTGNENLFSYVYPVTRMGKIVGHVWANIKEKQIYKGAILNSIYIIIGSLALLVFVLFAIWVLFSRIRHNLEEFSKAIISDNQMPISSKIMPELWPVIELVKDKTKDLRDKNRSLEQEIAERKNAEKLLRYSEEKLSKIFYNNQMMISICDSEGIYIDVNETCANVFGYIREEMIGRNTLALGIWANPEDNREMRKGLLENGFVMNKEYKYRTKTGDYGYLVASASMIEMDNEKYLLVSGTDITQTKKLEDEFRQFELRFYSVFYNSPVIMAIVNHESGKIIDVNEEWSWLYGYSREEAIGRKYGELRFWKDPQERIRYLSIIKSEGFVKNFEAEIFTRYGNTRYISISAIQIRLDGEIVRISTTTDITEQKNTMRQLELSEERFYKVFNLSPSMISIRKVSDLTYIDVNESWLKCFGFNKEEVVGRSSASLKINMAKCILVNAVKNRIPLRSEKLCYRRKNGEEFTALISTEFVSVQGVECLITVMSDITFLEQVEKEMKHLERLNLIGQMAAGIGHEIRNPMTTVRGFLQHYKGKPVFEEYNEQLHFMIEELDRANAIITEFLSLARNKPAETRPSSLDAIIQSMMPILSANAMEEQKDIEFLNGNTTDILLDEKEIRQLILNLVRNGFEEMGVGGLITIRTYEDKGDVVLAVDDQGNGISEKNTKKIGTPFFTTKDTGTGLGLAICYSIAKRHNAVMDFTTGPSGTTFFVRFKKEVN